MASTVEIAFNVVSENPARKGSRHPEFFESVAKVWGKAEEFAEIGDRLMRSEDVQAATHEVTQLLIEWSKGDKTIHDATRNNTKTA